MLLLDKKNAKFSEVYGDYYSILFGTIYTRINNSDIVDDLVQEIFIRFFNKIDIIEESRIRAWLFSTMKNVLYEYYRKDKNLTKDVIIEDSTNDVALTFVNGFQDTRLIINEVIDSLDDPLERIIFDLIAIQNYNYIEAGDHIGLTRGQIKYRYGVIVKKIISNLEKNGITKLEDLL